MAQRAISHYGDMRREMVSETTRFLNWALEDGRRFPRIPRVRVDRGAHFSERVKVAFWSAAMLQMSTLQPTPADADLTSEME